LFALVLSLAACGSGNSSSSNTSSGSTTSAGGPAKELGHYEFSLSIHDPATSNNGKFYQAWADTIYKKTDGHVKITLYFSGSLASAADVGEMVETGGVDIGWIYTSYYKGQFPLTDVTNIPMGGFGDAVTTTNVLWDLYEKYDELKAEWASYKVLNLYGIPGMVFASVKAPIDSPDDLKGLTIRTPAGPITTLLTNLGASPVVMAPPDVYEALEKKNINGYIFEPAGIANFKLQEVTGYITDMPLYDGAFGLVMNWDKWNSLPAEYQKIIESTTQRAGSLDAAQSFSDAAVEAHKIIADAGCTWVTVTDEAKAEFQKAADIVIAKWPESVKKDNFDAAAYMADAISLAKYFDSQLP
jgi:TRAP-type C4-dicarboxylate transport system substrate-binding protein